MMKLQLLLAFSFFTSGVVPFDDPHDTEALCADKGFTGFRATRDCRGYVHCIEGRLTAGHANGGVISCWPNQLYDEEIGICAHWTVVDRKGQHCPDFRQEMMMPDVKDENAMEEFFFCGETANHAATICEPCEGGSRLECKNPIHNCFAKITRCATSADEGGNVSNVEEPVIKMQLVQQLEEVSAASQSAVAKESTSTEEMKQLAGLVAPSPTPSPIVAAYISSPTFNEVLEPNEKSVSRKTNSVSTCGVSWALMVNDCSRSQPCPSGLNEDCPNGQICFAGSPCGESEQVSSIDKSAVNVSSQSNTGVVSTCGVSWALMVNDCSKSQPCPSGLNEDCPNGQICFAGSPCGESEQVTSKSVVGQDTTSVESAQSKAGDVSTCGVSWALMVNDCSKSQPCPSGLSEECPNGQICFAGSPCGESEQVSSIEKSAAYVSSQSSAGDVSTCGVSWALMVNDCSKSQPCPSGLSEECPNGQICFVGSPCGESEQVMSGSVDGQATTTSSSDKSAVNVSSQSNAGVVSTCGVSWALMVNDCSKSQPCPSGLSEECPNGQICFAGSPCGESEQAMSGPVEYQINASDADTWNTCGISWSWMVNDCESAKPCPSGSNDECPSGETCFAGSPCGHSSSPPQPAVDSNEIERKEYCSTKLDWLKDLNECSIPSSCPNDDSVSCPSGYKCVDCRVQTDAPTLEVRCVPHSRHTSVEGCSVRCCVSE